MSKLASFRQRLGEYYYSCQFRNKPIPPGGNVFKTEWLRRFVFKTISVEYNLIKTDKQIEKEYYDKYRNSESGTFGIPTYEVLPVINDKKNVIWQFAMRFIMVNNLKIFQHLVFLRC